MRYNLREHVKTMKSDKAKSENNDMSSQRWPKGKHWLQSRQLLESIPLSKVVDSKAKKFYMFTENEPEKGIPPKYLKRDLTTSSSEDGINVESLYVYQTETKIDSSNYSVEAMIENLIESSFEGLTNLVNLETNNTLNNSVDENSSLFLYPVRNESLENSNNTEKIYYNETIPNFLYKKIDRKTLDLNGNGNDTNITQSSQREFLEIITKMSNKIEKQNNNSIDIINRIAGNNLRKNIPYPANFQQDMKIDNITTFSNEAKTKEVSKIKRDITIIELSFFIL
ncbi:unnamed protein product [Parnassius apollo]|uniref:(apollo) hypothetical protein n=1 Tax=Parnassius apollo TaxID=110799 RepID=A0A8S3Y3U9_PARAO|nr:unnamed protein product [Parnassius apollo]